MGAVFAELNKGSAVTSGLRKVKKGEGIADRPIPVPKGPKAAAKAAPKAAEPARPPKCELSGKKWEVEYQARRRSPSAMRVPQATWRQRERTPSPCALARAPSSPPRGVASQPHTRRRIALEHVPVPLEGWKAAVVRNNHHPLLPRE